MGLRGPLFGWALLPPFFPSVPIVPVYSDSEAGWGLPREEVVAEGLGTSPQPPLAGKAALLKQNIPHVAQPPPPLLCLWLLGSPWW